MSDNSEIFRDQISDPIDCLPLYFLPPSRFVKSLTQSYKKTLTVSSPQNSRANGVGDDEITDWLTVASIWLGYWAEVQVRNYSSVLEETIAYLRNQLVLLNDIQLRLSRSTSHEPTNTSENTDELKAKIEAFKLMSAFATTTFISPTVLYTLPPLVLVNEEGVDEPELLAVFSSFDDLLCFILYHLLVDTWDSQNRFLKLNEAEIEKAPAHQRDDLAELENPFIVLNRAAAAWCQVGDIIGETEAVVLPISATLDSQAKSIVELKNEVKRLESKIFSHLETNGSVHFLSVPPSYGWQYGSLSNGSVKASSPKHWDYSARTGVSHSSPPVAKDMPEFVQSVLGTTLMLTKRHSVIDLESEMVTARMCSVVNELLVNGKLNVSIPFLHVAPEIYGEDVEREKVLMSVAKHLGIYSQPIHSVGSESANGASDPTASPSMLCLGKHRSSGSQDVNIRLPSPIFCYDNALELCTVGDEESLGTNGRIVNRAAGEAWSGIANYLKQTQARIDGFVHSESHGQEADTSLLLEKLVAKFQATSGLLANQSVFLASSSSQNMVADSNARMPSMSPPSPASAHANIVVTRFIPTNAGLDFRQPNNELCAILARRFSLSLAECRVNAIKTDPADARYWNALGVDLGNLFDEKVNLKTSVVCEIPASHCCFSAYKKRNGLPKTIVNSFPACERANILHKLLIDDAVSERLFAQQDQESLYSAALRIKQESSGSKTSDTLASLLILKNASAQQRSLQLLAFGLLNDRTAVTPLDFRALNRETLGEEELFSVIGSAEGAAFFANSVVTKQTCFVRAIMLDDSNALPWINCCDTIPTDSEVQVLRAMLKRQLRSVSELTRSLQSPDSTASSLAKGRLSNTLKKEEVEKAEIETQSMLVKREQKLREDEQLNSLGRSEGDPTNTIRTNTSRRTSGSVQQPFDSVATEEVEMMLLVDETTHENGVIIGEVLHTRKDCLVNAILRDPTHADAWNRLGCLLAEEEIYLQNGIEKDLLREREAEREYKRLQKEEQRRIQRSVSQHARRGKTGTLKAGTSTSNKMEDSVASDTKASPDSEAASPNTANVSFQGIHHRPQISFVFEDFGSNSKTESESLDEEQQSPNPEERQRPTIQPIVGDTVNVTSHQTPPTTQKTHPFITPTRIDSTISAQGEVSATLTVGKSAAHHTASKKPKSHSSSKVSLQLKLKYELEASPIFVLVVLPTLELPTAGDNSPNQNTFLFTKEQCFTLAVEYDPSDGMAWNNLGVAMDVLSDLDQDDYEMEKNVVMKASERLKSNRGHHTLHQQMGGSAPYGKTFVDAVAHAVKAKNHEEVRHPSKKTKKQKSTSMVRKPLHKMKVFIRSQPMDKLQCLIRGAEVIGNEIAKENLEDLKVFLKVGEGRHDPFDENNTVKSKGNKKRSQGGCTLQ